MRFSRLANVTAKLFPAPNCGGTTFPAGGQFIAVIISEKPTNPYVQQWSASVQRELARNTTLELNYVGNNGTHLLDRVNINQPYPVTDAGSCQANPMLGDCPVSARTPYPNFTNGTGTPRVPLRSG
jgi:hypothetical protein